MEFFNVTPSDPLMFILNGIPGLEVAHIWISIPLSMFYILSLLGNFMILFVISKEQTLHKPMNLLLFMLALTDIALSSSAVPVALGIFWFHFKDITVSGCFTQIFFLNAIGAMQSAILVTMAFDRYVAICDPLRYCNIITNENIAKLGVLYLIRALLLVLPVPLLLQKLSFCVTRIIPQAYCEHMLVAKLSCSDTTVNKMYFIIPLGILMLDLTLIVLSYGLIIRAVVRISSKNSHQKALNTCTAHICVMLISYISALFSVLTQRFGQDIPPYIHSLLGNIYVLIPPILNPIIYGFKTKEIRDKVGKYICKMILPRTTGFKPA